MLKKIALILTAALLMPFAVAQDLDYGEGEFVANFDIDSAHTTDGTNYKISATGEAGPYGRVWLSYEFTDKLGSIRKGKRTLAVLPTVLKATNVRFSIRRGEGSVAMEQIVFPFAGVLGSLPVSFIPSIGTETIIKRFH